MATPDKKRKIAVAITHRTPYGRLKPVLRAIQSHPELELQVIVATPVHLHNLWFALKHGDFASLSKTLPWYFRARLGSMLHGRRSIDSSNYLARLVLSDGFPIHAYLPLFIEGGNLVTMTKSVASGILGLPEIFEELKPDIVLVHADRFEMLAVASAAALMNIPIAHTQGGDVSGTIDELMRHAITKLAHFHFPTTEQSKSRIIRMGEHPDRVFMVGCPTIDELTRLELSIDTDIYERNGNGHGDRIDLTKPFVLLMQHPVTTEYGQAHSSLEETLAAIQKINLPTLMFWPNIDAGFDSATLAVRSFIQNHSLPGLTLYKSFRSEDFYRVLNAATVAVGNSSSFIREGSYLGLPVVLVGTRQRGRERSDNIVEVGYDRVAIEDAIRKQMQHGRYPKSNLYGEGHAAEAIAATLASVKISQEKYFNDGI